MTAGLYEQAWSINDRAFQHWPSAHSLSRGRTLKSDVIRIVSWHGLGDAVQMLRFVPCLQARTKQVVFDLPEPLKPLLRFFSGASTLPSELGRREPAERHPAQDVEIMEVPYLLRLRIEQLSAFNSYLALPPDLTLPVDEAMGRGSRRVGVVWAGSSWDPDRWIPVADLARLFSNDHFSWWSLQGGDHATQKPMHGLRTLPGFQDGGLVNLAAAIASVDLLLTVDTLAAHLAGAMGIPCWLMLKHNADWRWMRDRDWSPWYPSMRLFRQPQPGDWQSVVDAVEAALDTMSSAATAADRS